MRRTIALLLAALLPSVPGAPAWAAVVRVAAPVSTPNSAVPGIGLSLDPSLQAMPAGLISKGSIGLQGSLPSWSGAQVLVSPVGAAPKTEAVSAPQALADFPAAALPAPAAQVRPRGEAPAAAPSAHGGQQRPGDGGPWAAARTLGNMQAAAILSGHSLRQESPDASYGASRTAFDRLIGAPAGVAPDSAASPVPAAPSRMGSLLAAPGPEGAREGSLGEVEAPETVQGPAQKSLLRRYLVGTGAFKLGMEALGLSIPLVALTVFGQVKWAAVMSVGWGLAQLVFSSMAGGLLDRLPAAKVISRAMTVQAAAVGVMIGLFTVDKLFPALIGFPLAHPIAVLVLYSLAGACLGVQDTARQVIPTQIIGKDEKALKIFNARTHIAYETSGVAAALLVGLIISKFGVLAALLLHPPAYLLSAWLFSGLHMPGSSAAPPAAAPEPAQSGRTSPAQLLRGYLADMKEGARTIFGEKALRWGMFALVVPVMIHRILEGLLIPVAAKSLLGNPAASAWMVGASNLGELVGAALLMRSLTRPDAKQRHSAFWVRIMAAGTLAFWVVTMTSQLPLILPLILFMSVSWAASDLSLRSKLQNAIPDSVRGRAFGFMSAVSFALILLVSLGLGFLFDAAAHAAVFVGVGAAFTVVAALLFWSAKALGAPSGGQVKDSR